MSLLIWKKPSRGFEWKERKKKSIMNPEQEKRSVITNSSESQSEETLFQRVESVLRKNGLEPKWDYSKAGQSVIMPTRKKDSGK